VKKELILLKLNFYKDRKKFSVEEYDQSFDESYADAFIESFSLNTSKVLNCKLSKS